METNNIRDKFAKSTILEAIASICIMIGTLIVFTILSVSLRSGGGGMDVSACILGVELQLIGLGLIIIRKYK